MRVIPHHIYSPAHTQRWVIVEGIYTKGQDLGGHPRSLSTTKTIH